MPTYVIAMQMLHRGPRAEQARRDLGTWVDGARVGEPGPGGYFEIEVDAVDRDSALQAVWNAIAAEGADDDIAFAEHPDLPYHFRREPLSPEEHPIIPEERGEPVDEADETQRPTWLQGTEDHPRRKEPIRADVPDPPDISSVPDDEPPHLEHGPTG